MSNVTPAALLARKTRSAVRRVRQFAHPLTTRLTHRRVIERLTLGVCTACEYDCVSCSHQAIRYRFRRYQMSLDEVRTFLRLTEASGYRIEQLQITGPGEPLLWAHFTEGLRLLRASKAIGFIEIISDGLAVEQIKPDAWTSFDRLWISLYPETAHLRPTLETLRMRHPEQLRIRSAETFRSPVPAGTVLPIPCACDCPGPMVFNGRVFYYCGPTVFDAAAAAGVDLLADTSMSGPLRERYLERPDASDARDRWTLLAPVDRWQKTGTHALCRHCFANRNSEPATHAHRAYIRVRPIPGVDS